MELFCCCYYYFCYYSPINNFFNINAKNSPSEYIFGYSIQYIFIIHMRHVLYLRKRTLNNDLVWYNVRNGDW